MKLEPEHAVRTVKKWLSRLGLDAWTFDVAVYDTESDAPGSKDSEAYVIAKPEARYAMFSFNAWHFDDEAAFELAAVHETVHVLLWLHRMALRKTLPHKFARVIDEQAVDQLAIAFAALDPPSSRGSSK